MIEDPPVVLEGRGVKMEMLALDTVEASVNVEAGVRKQHKLYWWLTEHAADSDSWKHDKFEELEQQGEEVDGQEQEELKHEDSRIFEPTEQENESNNKKPSTSSTSTEEDLSKEEQGIKGEQQPGVSEQDSDKRKDVEPSDRSPKRRRSSS